MHMLIKQGGARIALAFGNIPVLLIKLTSRSTDTKY